MTFSKTSVAAIAIGCLAIGVGAARWLARPDSAAAPDTSVAAPNAGDVAIGTTPTATEPSPAPAAEPARAADNAPPASHSTAAAARPAHAGAKATPAPPSTHAPVQEPRPATSQRAPEPAAAVADARPASAPATPPAAPVAPAKAPEPMFEELLVSADSVLGLRIETALSSETAHVEDKVVATVTRDVRVGNRVAIPSGAKAYGEVTLVELGGKLKERARLGVRFTSLALGSGRRTAIQTDVLLREGDSAARESAAKIGGGALGGAIIGGIIGGKKGAAVGSTIGAGAGTAAVMAGGRNAATLESGAEVTVRLTKPATIAVER